MESLCRIHLYYKRRWWASNSNVQGISQSQFQYFNPPGFSFCAQVDGSFTFQNIPCEPQFILQELKQTVSLRKDSLSLCPGCFSSIPTLLSVPLPLHSSVLSFSLPHMSDSTTALKWHSWVTLECFKLLTSSYQCSHHPRLRMPGLLFQSHTDHDGTWSTTSPPIL